MFQGGNLPAPHPRYTQGPPGPPRAPPPLTTATSITNRSGGSCLNIHNLRHQIEIVTDCHPCITEFCAYANDPTFSYIPKPPVPEQPHLYIIKEKDVVVTIYDPKDGLGLQPTSRQPRCSQCHQLKGFATEFGRLRQPLGSEDQQKPENCGRLRRPQFRAGRKRRYSDISSGAADFMNSEW